MEKQTIGKFISALRRASGITQRELGDRLFVSDKTVSRWERDESLPDLALIPAIAEIFGISTDELLRGERDPERQASEPSESARRRSERQLRLMLSDREKRYSNLTLVSTGISVLGLIVAMISDLAFMRARLGFLLSCIFFACAVIFQICVVRSSLIDSEGEDEEYSDRINALNTKMAVYAVRAIFTAVAIVAFCLPLITEMNDAYAGLTFDYWMPLGILFLGICALICYVSYELFIRRILISRGLLVYTDIEMQRFEQRKKILRTSCIIGALVFILILAAYYVIDVVIGKYSFIHKERFDDPLEFKAYMESDYDEWYQEGYGIKDGYAPNEDYPGIVYDSVTDYSGKEVCEYYFNPDLYHDVFIGPSPDGSFEIVVVGLEDYYKGSETYNMLIDLCTLAHILNAAAFVLIYYLRLRKTKAESR